MKKQTGMMEIAFTNGLVTIKNNPFSFSLKDFEKNLKKDRNEIFGKYIEEIKDFITDDFITLDLLEIFKKELEFNDEDFEILKQALSIETTIRKVVEISEKMKDRNNVDDLKGFVYFISDGHNYKIGKTKNIKKRIKSLQVGNSGEIELINFVSNKKYDLLERFIHAIFKKHHIRGEWFSKAKEIESFFKIFGEHHEGWDNEEDDAEAQKKRSEIIDRLVGAIEMKYVRTWEDVKEFFNKI